MGRRKMVALLSLLCLVTIVLSACGATLTTTKTSAPTPPLASASSSTPSPTSKPAASSPPSEPLSFAGKTVTIIVPVTAGGSSDTIARLTARRLSAFLPGKPNVIVRNMPGAGTILAVNYFYASVKPDGLTVLEAGGGANLAQLVGLPAVAYDMLKYSVIMGMSSGSVVYTRPSIVSRPEDILKAKGMVYGSSAGSSAYLFVTSQQTLNFPTDKATFAYPGTADARRAFLAGEINMAADPATSFKDIVAPYVTKGEIAVLYQYGVLGEKGNLEKASDVPTEFLTVQELYEKLYSRSPTGPAWDAYKAVTAAARNYDNMLFLPPGTPADIVKVYWDAADAMVKDPEFRSSAEPLVGKDARWNSGEAYHNGYKLNFGVKPEIREWLRSTLQKYGVTIA